MRLVWVRTVLKATTSSRAISGPDSSVLSNRRTSSSRWLRGSIRGEGERGRGGEPAPKSFSGWLEDVDGYFGFWPQVSKAVKSRVV